MRKEVLWLTAVAGVMVLGCIKGHTTGTGSGLQPPVNQSPANGAANLATSPALVWDTSSGATLYGLEVSTTLSFASPVVSQAGMTGTSATVTGLLNSTTYYWRVNAANISGTSGWSGVWSFATSSSANTAAPGVPVPASPANGATEQSAAPALSWSSGSGGAVVSYAVELSSSAGFSSFIVYQSGVTASGMTPSGLSNGTTYYWRVNAANANGTSGWTISWSFTTANGGGVPPVAPVLFSPANGAANVSLITALQWNSVSGATGYHLQLSTTNAFSSAIIDDSTLAGNSATTDHLLGNTIYYWKVRAKNPAGTSGWSGTWMFSTLVPPIQLLYPSGGEIFNVGDTVTIRWRVNDSTSVSSVVLVLFHGSLSTTLGTGSFSPNTLSYKWIVTGSEVSSSCYIKAKEYYNSAAPDSSGLFSIRNGTITSGMVFIPGGTFIMGSSDSLFSRALPLHQVTVSAFYMDSTDVTQAGYQALMGVNPSYFNTGASAPRRPVENVTWLDAVLYCNKRSNQDGKDTVYSYASISRDSIRCTGLGNITADVSKNGYRLPTEAEWEYACRAGSVTAYCWGQGYPPQTSADTAQISAHAWWQRNAAGTQPVAARPPNAWGLYDMSGNAWQWCNDWYGDYSSGAQTDPAGPTPPTNYGNFRVLRGGSWDSTLVALRATYRNLDNQDGWGNNIGFRCVRR